MKYFVTLLSREFSPSFFSLYSHSSKRSLQQSAFQIVCPYTHFNVRDQISHLQEKSKREIEFPYILFHKILMVDQKTKYFGIHVEKHSWIESPFDSVTSLNSNRYCCSQISEHCYGSNWPTLWLFPESSRRHPNVLRFLSVYLSPASPVASTGFFSSFIILSRVGCMSRDK
jgi:hypothetical protein